MHPKHDWGAIMDKPAWEKVSKVIDRVMKEGREVPYKAGKGGASKILNINGKNVMVTFEAKTGIPGNAGVVTKPTWGVLKLGKTEKQRLKEFVLTGRFDQALKIAKSISFKKLMRYLYDLFYEQKEENEKKGDHIEIINHYIFIWYLIENTKNKKLKAKYHALASEILLLHLNTLHYAESLAVFHCKKAIELDPTNLSLKESFLSAMVTPNLTQDFITKEEAYKTVKEVLKKKPKHGVAKLVLEMLGEDTK